MAKLVSLVIVYALFVFLVTMSMHCVATNEEERQVHIVYMGSLPKGQHQQYSPSSHHHNILQDILDQRLVVDSLVRSYRRSFNGFAAKLTNQESRKLANIDGVVSVFPSRTLQLHTTRSWDFMGFPETVKRQTTIESNVIVGVLDIGIWPESESFCDEGFSPPPSKWKGSCNGGANFTCNNKIIGARAYSSIFGFEVNETARDRIGHGTHTASTAAGNNVENATFYGLAGGTARGGVPSARVAVYKVCTEFGCQEADLLAAFDDAISDGVDMITTSLGPENGVVLTHDAISIGAFHAMEKGILTVQSAGNSGPQSATLSSIAPWVLTVAASNTDRRFIDKVVLGSGQTFVGTSVNSFTGSNFSVLFGNDATSQCSEFTSQRCLDGCLDANLVHGKVVFCNNYRGIISEAIRAGAAGVLGLEYIEEHDVAFVVPLPASRLTAKDFSTILSYFNSTEFPQANILKSEAANDLSAPVVASFSSSGPNPSIPDILKPDISAPVVEILAAFSPIASPSDNRADKRSAKYNILSGTSMSCPHVAGVSAYVKTFHPDWSPSAIKSALMTTAWPMNATGDSSSGGEFGFGSGHINPIKALNPGLVYETFKEDYIKMLCGIGYMNSTKVRLVAGYNITCPDKGIEESAKDLNYPSMTSKVESNVAFEVEFSRTVTNVGIANSTYKAQVTNNSSDVNVAVRPSILSFSALYERKSFALIVDGKGLVQSMVVSASLVWSDGTHTVRSPIVIYT